MLTLPQTHSVFLLSTIEREHEMESHNFLPNRFRTGQSSTQLQPTSPERLGNTASWHYNPQPLVLAWLEAIEPESDTHYPTTFKLPLQPRIKVHMPPQPTLELPLLSPKFSPRIIRNVSIEIPMQPTPSKTDTTFSLAVKPLSWLNLLKDSTEHPSSLQLYVKTSIEKIAFERGSLGLLQTIVWANLYKHDVEQKGFWEIVEAEVVRRLPPDTDYFMRVHGNTDQFKLKLADIHFKEDEFYVGDFGGEFLWMRYEEGRDLSLRVLKNSA